MTTPRAGSAIVQHNNSIYIIGGVDGNEFLKTIESANVLKDGSLSPWKIIADLPEARGFMSAVVHKNRLYVVGGANGKHGKNLLSSIVSASIKNAGELGEWRQEKQSMLIPRRCSKLIKNGSTLYALGGFGGSLLDSVEKSSFGKNGTLSPWRLEKNPMTMPRYVNSVSKIAGEIYVMGGHHPTKGLGLAHTESAKLQAPTLQWKKFEQLQAGRYAFSSFSDGENLYAAGGISGSEYLNSVEMLDVTVKNAEIGWQKSTNLPLFMANFTTIVVGKNVYLLGGSTRHNYLNSVWFSSFGENGKIGFWGTSKDVERQKLQNKNDFSKNELVNSGTVISQIETDGYTYLLVKEKNRQIWLAGPKMQVSTNSRVRYSEGVYMSNFFSKSLNKTFQEILFVGTVLVDHE